MSSIKGEGFMISVTVSEAKRNLEQLIEQVLSNVEPAVVCTDTGQRIVLLSLDEFNSWQETLYLLSNPANAEHLRQSIMEAKIGKTVERSILEV
jgi:antitoxin YefM